MNVSRRGAIATTLVVAILVSIAAIAAAPASAGVVPIAIGGRTPESPSISGSRVVWSDRSPSGRGSDVFMYDMTTRKTSVLISDPSDQVAPHISGNLVTWVDYAAGNADVYALDLSTGIRTVIANGGNDEVKPVVSGSWVAWQEITVGGSKYVWARNLVTGEFVGVDIRATNPRICGNLLTYEWQAYRNAPIQVRVYNLATKVFTNVGGGNGMEVLPDTDGRYVTYVRYDTVGGFNVYAYDTQTGATVAAASGPGEQTAPRVANGVVYYLDVQTKGQIRLKAASAADGSAVAFNSYGTGDVAGTDADGQNLAWMEKTRTGWRIRGLFNTPSTGLVGMLSSARAAAISAMASLRPRDFSSPYVTGTYRRALTPRSPAYVYFSEKLNAKSAIRGVRLVNSATGLRVPARVRYIARRKAVSIAPIARLAAGDYQVVIASSVRDLAGNKTGATQVVPLGGVSAAAVGAPTSPICSVVGSTGDLRMKWNLVPGAASYRVVRLNRPIYSGNFSAATQVASVTAPPAAITAASDEASTSYTYYYAVYAVDSLGATSVLSANSSPDPHGASIPGYSFYACQRCHTAHGGPAPGVGGQVAVQATNCYACHGSSSQSSSYATGAPVNVQAQFNDYTPGIATASVPTVGNGGWSIHRTSAMVQNRNECEACHTPHRRPYYRDPATGNHGAAEAAFTYPKLLRVKTATNPVDAYMYSSETTPSGNSMCFACHGTVGVEGSAGSLTSMILANGGDSGAGGQSLDRTAGDHNSANWTSATLAHGTSNVPATPGGVGIQCEVCHNNHGASSDKLLDYRRSATQTVDAYKQSKLCFECHASAANGADETLSVGARPYTWNGRDVKAEFARHSTHPTATAASGRSLTCYSCHNTHYVQEGTAGKQWDVARVSDPTNTKSTPTTTTDFCMDCHGTIKVTQAFNRTWMAPYTVTTSTPGGTFPGWQKTMWTGSGHASATVANGRAWCDNCHDPHASDFDRLVAWSSNNQAWSSGTPNTASRTGTTSTNASNIKGTTSEIGYKESFEEALCLQCHGSVSVVTSDGVTIPSKKAPGAADVATEMAGMYRHPTQGPSGRHSDVEGPSAFGVANRHAECVDCHDPHSARKANGDATHTVGSSLAGGALYGVFGVVPSYPTTSPYSASTTYPSNFATPTATWTYYQLDGGAQDNEAYLCFKCHSSYTTLPTTISVPSRNTTPTNVAQEFNPQNFSFHNVVGAPASQTFKTMFTYKNSAGTTVTTQFNANPTTASVFTGSWGFSSKMTCTDCHSNSTASASGPHGSSVKWMIDPNYPGDWLTANLSNFGTNRVICSKCHNTNTTSGLPNAQQAHAADTQHQSTATCVYCHIKVPHGWRRPRMIGYMSDPEPYRSTWMQRIPATAGTINFSSEQDCYNSAGCGGKHSSAPATYWP